MKKINITRMVLAAIMMVFGAANLMADVGDLITTKTKEGVKMTFVVEKDDRCSVYSDCIDKSVTGIVTIPEEVYGNTVVGINNEAFRDCSVSEIVIPQTVKFIGNNAFRDCKNLKKCWLPDSIVIHDTVGPFVYYYGESAYLFAGCESLEDVYLPHHLKMIPEHAFEGCKSLKSIVIPASVDVIREDAFKDCSSLSSVIFLGKIPGFYEITIYEGVDEDNITPIWSSGYTETYGVFYGTPYTSYQGTTYSDVTIYAANSGDIDKYQKQALWEQFNTDENPSLNDLGTCPIFIRDHETLGYMVSFRIGSYIASNSCYECDFFGTEEKLGEEFTSFTLPEKILDFSVTAMSSVKMGGSMDYLKNAVVPGTCKRIGFYGYGFAGCTALEEVELQEGIEDVNDYVFANTALKELRFPLTLKYYTSCVQNCPNLTDVYIPVWKLTNWYGGEYGRSGSQATLHVPYTSTQNYEDMIPTEFAKIEEMDPQDGDIFTYPHKTGKDMKFQIISVADKTCRVYGENVFSPSIDTNTEGTVNIPAKPLGYTVVELGSWAFSACQKLTFVNIPNTVERIGTLALAGCKEMVSANIPASVKEIGESAFQADDKLVNVFLSEGLEKILANGFAFCQALETITLPQSLNYLGRYAFQGSVLTSIEIPSGVNQIYSYTFQNCKKLESVFINEGLQTIDGQAFEGCESLASIDLPRSVSKLNTGAFRNCPKLVDVTIRNSHIVLGDLAGNPVDDNEAFSYTGTRNAKLTVPMGTQDYYGKSPWTVWFSNIEYALENIPTGITLPATPSSLPEVWYTLDGQQLPTAPTRPGLYIQNGKKTIVK